MNDSTLVLTESKSARADKMANVTHDSAMNALCKAKALVMAMWQGTGVATTEQMASYYQVTIETVKMTLSRHRDEFDLDGVREIKGKELKALQSQGSDDLLLPEKTTRLNIWTPRAALRLGMLLRDSEVAKQVRTVLLDVVEHTTKESLETAFSIPRNFVEALRLAADLEDQRVKLLEENQALQVEVQALEPKAERYDLVIDSDGWMTGEEICKQLAIPKFSNRKLYDILRQEKVLFKRPDGTNCPYASWVNEGLAKLRDGQCFDGRMRFSPVFSWKGLDRILDLLRKHRIISKDKQYRFKFDSSKIVAMKRA